MPQVCLYPTGGVRDIVDRMGFEKNPASFGNRGCGVQWNGIGLVSLLGEEGIGGCHLCSAARDLWAVSRSRCSILVLELFYFFSFSPLLTGADVVFSRRWLSGRREEGTGFRVGIGSLMVSSASIFGESCGLFHIRACRLLIAYFWNWENGPARRRSVREGGGCWVGRTRHALGDEGGNT
jgi:hypothetical protein